jgi:hypothetical protein
METPIIGQWFNVSDESDRIYMQQFVGKDIRVVSVEMLRGEPVLIEGVTESGNHWNGYINRLSPSTKKDLFNQ